MNMPALSLHQPWASLLVTRQPIDPATFSTFGGGPIQMVKRFETRSWPFPPALIGQPIAFHATQKRPQVAKADHGRVLRAGGADPAIYGPERTYSNGDQRCWQAPATSIVNGPTPVMLPLGAIVGSGRITASYPIVSAGSGVTDKRIYAASGGLLALMHGGGDFTGEDWDEEWTDISDQLPYGDFAPGRYAWLIEDAAPTTERCPWCDGKGLDYEDHYGLAGSTCLGDCPVCDGAGHCDPIPVKGAQRIWNWTP